MHILRFFIKIFEARFIDSTGLQKPSGHLFLVSSLQEIMQLARELCLEQELLANFSGAMPGKTPG